MTNDDASAVTSVLSDNVRLFMAEGWARIYSDEQKLHYLHKLDVDSVWEKYLDKAIVIPKKDALPSYNQNQNISNTKDTRLVGGKN